MKFLVAFTLLIVAVIASDLYTDEELTRMKTISKECEEATHVEHDTILEMRKGHFEEDTHLKDYLFCFMKKMHWQHDDGTMDKDHIKKDLHRSTTALDAMNHCLDKHGSTGSETAFIVMKCYKDHLPAGFKATL